MLKNRKAVSPVVGVILMVAATIVIAAIVMGFLGGFKPPKRPLDVQLEVTEAKYNNTTWTVLFTIAGSEANVLSPTSTDKLEVTAINQTGTELQHTVKIYDHSLLRVVGTNEYAANNHTHYYYYVNDNHPELKIVVKYKPTGQILFDNVVIAYNESS